MAQKKNTAKKKVTKKVIKKKPAKKKPAKKKTQEKSKSLAVIDTDQGQVLHVEAVPIPTVEKHKVEWQNNHAQIEAAFLTFIRDSKSKRMPTYTELAALSGLSLSTINRHCKGMKTSYIEDRVKVLGGAVAQSLAHNAIYKHDTAAAKVFLQFFFNMTERHAIEHSGRVDFRDMKEELKNEKDMDEAAKKISTILRIQSRAS